MARVTRRRRSPAWRASRGRRSGGESPWKNGPIPVIGVVGGIGAGKSEVARILEELGAFRIDADAVGHALLEQRPCRDLVLKRFGPGIATAAVAAQAAPAEPSSAEAPPDEAEQPPGIDRSALGRLVFRSPEARRDLEAILHPRMVRTFAKAIDREGRRGRHQAVVLDAAILFEAGWERLCDLVVCVDAPRPLRLSRLEQSRGWTHEKLAAREAAQWPLPRKRAQADVVLENAATAEQLRAAVEKFWKQLVGSRSQRGSAPRTP